MGGGRDQKQIDLHSSALLSSRDPLLLCVDDEIQYPYLYRIEASNASGVARLGVWSRRPRRGVLESAESGRQMRRLWGTGFRVGSALPELWPIP